MERAISESYSNLTRTARADDLRRTSVITWYRLQAGYPRYILTREYPARASHAAAIIITPRRQHRRAAAVCAHARPPLRLLQFRGLSGCCTLVNWHVAVRSKPPAGARASSFPSAACPVDVARGGQRQIELARAYVLRRERTLYHWHARCPRWRRTPPSFCKGPSLLILPRSRSYAGTHRNPPPLLARASQTYYHPQAPK
ncbi:hypothetical protein K438DRAFT_1115692 [Mycena galopus ATCC 62051]|nr:hypothetical protein K438DRAFT_1115692 [Mycena galopus ATCC 62051]